MKCPECAADIAEGSQFCDRCGALAAGRPQAPPQPAQSPARPPRTAAQGGPAGGAGMKVATGIASIAAAGFIIAGCAFPYVKYTIAGHTTSVSVFNAGPGSSASNLWFAVEPIVVAALAIAGGILLMRLGPGRFRLVVAGTLVAFGFQTMLLFLGYALGLSYSGNRQGIGGPLGLVGGYLLAGAGAVAAASRSAQPAGSPPAAPPV